MEIKKFPIHNDLACLTKKLELAASQQQMPPRESIILFFSFDVVNSTGYKATNKGKWMEVISEILNHIISSFSNASAGGYRFWKTLGDEIIYTKEIHRTDEIVDTLEFVYAKMRSLNQQIANGLLCDEESAKILGIKAAVWIADISHSGSAGDNIYTEYLINDNRRQTEYIGPDIDIGFRVAGHSMYNHMVVSFELAYLMLQFDTSPKKRVHLLGYRELKGVWEGAPYPIIIFNGDCDADIVEELNQKHPSKIESRNEFIYNLKKWKMEQNPEKGCVFLRIANEMNLLNKINRMVEIIKQKRTVPPHGLKLFKKVYYAALCYQLKNDELVFLFAKRKTDDLWRFGGKTIYHNFSYVTTVKQHYQDTFGLEIDILDDTMYNNPTPIVLTKTSFIEGESPLENSSCFLAEIKSDLRNISTPSDWDVRLLTLEELLEFDEPCVENLNTAMGNGLKLLALKYDSLQNHHKYGQVFSHLSMPEKTMDFKDMFR